MSNLFILVLQITVILIGCRLVAWLFARIHQPVVVGEMLAGILLGPSLLGWLAPGLSTSLFPPSSLPNLNAISQLGVILFMFLVGLEVDFKELRHQGHAALLTSHVSISVPFFLAALLSLYLYPRLSSSQVAFSNFALFMGAAMSITAFPVLARILTERRLLHSRLGTASIACAAVDDATGWCILAYILARIRAGQSTTPSWITALALVAFVLLMFFGVRVAAERFARSFHANGVLHESTLGMILICVLIASLCTEALGIHLLFGAFLMGAIMPKDREFVRHLQERFQTVAVTLLLPLFFAFTGLRTSVALVKGTSAWMYCLLVIVVAILGKFGGSFLAAWISGMPKRDAAGLGALLNTRGLMELVVLNIGLDNRVISPALFSMMVLMALFTTVVTTPVLQLIYPQDSFTNGVKDLVLRSEKYATRVERFSAGLKSPPQSR